MSNIYLDLVLQNLPRVLGLFDVDPTSPSFGIADRCFWGWKVTDFADASYQRLLHGLALLLANDLLPKHYSREKVLSLFDFGIRALGRITRHNGSVDQAFPYESSFGATAFVAYDLLSAVIVLKPLLSDTQCQDYQTILKPLITFLCNHSEDHGFISNHLAAAANVLYKWEWFSGEAVSEKAEKILKAILERQSSEGWFVEYEGADPGYQTLCTYYLADLYCFKPELDLLSSLQKSVRFLSYFAHPDGSFGGVYGSRNTRFYFPSGIELLAADIVEAQSLATFMRKSIKDLRVVMINSVDSENLIPMFNYYTVAAIAYQNNPKSLPKIDLPAFYENTGSINFKEAGIYIEYSAEHYVIINYFKGGVCYAFNKLKQTKLIDLGLVYSDKNNNFYASQSYDKTNYVEMDPDKLVIKSKLARIKKMQPSPAKFLLLRLLNVTVMRLDFCSQIIKKLLVWLLITKKTCVIGYNMRTISLGLETEISDHSIEEKQTLIPNNKITYFSSIHMASQGYYQEQDYETKTCFFKKGDFINES